MAIPLRHSIAGQLLRYVFGLYFLIALAVTGVQLILEYRDIKEDVRKELEKSEQIFGPGITESLWTFNGVLLQSIMRGMNENHAVVGVKVEATMGSSSQSIGIVENNTDGALRFGGLIKYEFPSIFVDQAGRPRHMGSVIVYSSQDIVLAAVKDSLVLIMVNAAIKTAALWIILFYFIRRILARPLEEMSNEIVGVRLDSLKNIDVASDRQNELSKLVDAFNRMIDGLKEARSQLQGANEKLEFRVAERTYELETAEQRYLAVVNNMEEGLMILEDSVIAYGNPALGRLLGRPAESLIGLPFTRTIAPADAKMAFDRHLRRMNGENVPAAYEVRMLNAETGEAVPTWASISRVETRNGRVLTIGTLTDLTGQKEIELKLEDANKELLQRERLATLGQLTATVTHELRNPLGAMITSASLLQKRLAGSDIKVDNAVSRIRRNVMRCDRIIDELLDFSRDRTLQLEPTNIEARVEDVLDEQKIPASIDVILEFNTADEICLVDPDSLRRAFINLFENACHAMTDIDGVDQTDEMTLVIRTRLDGDFLEIEIQDSGAGFSPDIQDRLFEPMFSTRGFGVGLGLAAVRKIADKHDGSVELVNNEGRGASARFRLPRHNQERGVA